MIPPMPCYSAPQRAFQVQRMCYEAFGEKESDKPKSEIEMMQKQTKEREKIGNRGGKKFPFEVAI